MSQVTNYDAIVIGTSQGGRFLPIALAKAGQKWQSLSVETLAVSVSM